MTTFVTITTPIEPTTIAKILTFIMWDVNHLCTYAAYVTNLVFVSANEMRSAKNIERIEHDKEEKQNEENRNRKQKRKEKKTRWRRKQNRREREREKNELVVKYLT